MYVQQISKTMESKCFYGGQIGDPCVLKHIAINRIRSWFGCGYLVGKRGKGDR